MVDIAGCIDFCQYRVMSKRRTLVECCPPVLQGELLQAAAAELAAAFQALSDPARLRVLSLIAAQPSGEACVCHFTGRLELSQPTVSHHLKVLFNAGILERERRGTWVYYRIVPARLEALRAALAAPRVERKAEKAECRPKRRA